MFSSHLICFFIYYLQAADIIFISVNTPTKTTGIGALHPTSRTVNYARKIAEVATTDKIIVEKSTVPVRTAESIKRVLALVPSKSFKFFPTQNLLLRVPLLMTCLILAEFLSGSKPAGLAAIEKLVSVYANWVPRAQILTTNLWSSELSKLVANAYFAQRVSSINSITALCEQTDADVDEISRAIGSITVSVLSS